VPNIQRSDPQIEMDVVRALGASNALKQDSITAVTVQGEVTLSGRASNEAAKELAEWAVSHVQGCPRFIISLLQLTQLNPAPTFRSGIVRAILSRTISARMLKAQKKMRGKASGQAEKHLSQVYIRVSFII